LLGHFRITPPPTPSEGGIFPFLAQANPPRDPHTNVALVSFAHRPRTSGTGFYDYTARYGAVREEDRVTLRESMFGDHDYLNLRPNKPEDQVSKSPEELAVEERKKALFEEMVEKLGLSQLLDLPLVALSNGQTRRARIVKALLARPELLILDEPLTGLDVSNRPKLLDILHSLHVARNPRILLGLRLQDPVPEWITHLALISEKGVITGQKDIVLEAEAERRVREERDSQSRSSNASSSLSGSGRSTVVDLKNVSVTYGPRQVLKEINWTIREGQRWHLKGPNGSGKTTLLALLTGDHPQSYTQLGTSRHLRLFSRPRSRIPTPQLRSLIGVVSPELANAYPRRACVSVWEVIGTGFDGAFVPGGLDGVGHGIDGPLSDEQRRWRVQRVREVLSGLGPSSWAPKQRHDSTADSQTEADAYGGKLKASDATFAERDFADLAAGEQAVVLLMRALVGRPRLVLLDEVWSGMDDSMVRAARAYLRDGSGVGDDQAVVVISHWEEEVPWNTGDGLRRISLEDGVATCS